MIQAQVIIVGCQRSGTSALWRSLRTHPDLAPTSEVLNNLPVGCEKEFWPINDFLRSRAQSKDSDRKCHGNKLDQAFMEEFGLLAERFLMQHFGSQSGGWIYSHPADGLFANEILSALPRVRLVFLFRHPQEVVWSMVHAPWQKQTGRSAMLRKAHQGAKHWNAFARAHQAARNGAYPDRLLTVYSENLRHHPERSLGEILAFLGLDPEAKVAETFVGGTFNSSFLPNGTPVGMLDRQREAIGEDAEFCAVVTRHCEAFMAEHGYQPIEALVRLDPGAAPAREAANDADPLQEAGDQNEDYWLKHVRWHKEELDRSCDSMSACLSQEVFLTSYLTELALRSGDGALELLELGFGFGRHLRYLKDLPGVECHGCDISHQALEDAAEWAEPDWAADRLTLIQPRQPLPYKNGQFDVVLTVAVLIHIQPDDLLPVLRELTRIGRRLVLHIENPKTDVSRKTSDMHNGCWAHPLETLYRSLGYRVTVMPQLSERMEIYAVSLTNERPMLGSCEKHNPRLLKLEDNYQRLHAEHLRLKRRSQDLEHQLEEQRESFERTRAAKFQRWLSSHPWIEVPLVYLVDRAVDVKRALSPSKPSIFPVSRGAARSLEVGDPDANSLAICHPDWQGVRSAAEGQTPNRLLVPDLNEDDISDIVCLLEELAPRTILVNGFWKEYDTLMIALRKRWKDCRILYVHHGSLYQLQESPDSRKVLTRVFSLHSNGVIDRIGFVKPGVARAFSQLGVETWSLLNYVAPEPQPRIKTSSGPVRVGIPVGGSLRKNPHTQLVAALLVPGVDEIHVWHRPDLSYLKAIGTDLRKVIVHEAPTRERARELLNEMTFVLYATISECAPMVVLESFAAATPCFTGRTHELLAEERELDSALLIDEWDNPASIARHVEQQMGRIQELSEQVLAAYQRLSRDAKENIEAFTSF